MIYTDNPSIDALLHVIALERHSEITVLLNMQAMKLGSSAKTS
jgi:hypothetical protein